MTSSFSRVFSIVTLSVATVAATSSLAYAGGNGKKGGFSVGFGNGNVGVRLGNGGTTLRLNNGGGNNGGCNDGGRVNGGGYNNGGCQNGGLGNGGYNGGQYLGQAYEPLHSTYIVKQFDTLYLVSQREYGNSVALPYIARFNNLPVSAALTPGQRLFLPSISANGLLSPSRRPFAEDDPAAQAATPATTATSTSNLTSAANAITSNFASATKSAATESTLPKVTVGSTLLVDGQVFGETTGSARLLVGGLVLNVEVVEWTNNSAKVRLPRLELASPTKAEIEVLKSDGSVAAKSPIELTPATDRLASTN